MKIVSFIWTLLWKTVVVAVAVVLAALGASGVGFHGAELIAKLPLLKILAGFVGLSLGDEDVIGSFLLAAFGATVKFGVSAAICFGPGFLIYRIAKPVLLIMLPILLSVAAVGAWNGIANDFDVGRALSR